MLHIKNYHTKSRQNALRLHFTQTQVWVRVWVLVCSSYKLHLYEWSIHNHSYKHNSMQA